MTGLMDENHLNYYRQFGHTVAVWSAKLVIEDLLGHIDALTKVIADTADADTTYQAARGDVPSLEAMVGLGQAMSALHDVAKVIR